MTDHRTLDVIAVSLDAATTEMFEVLCKTAISPIIYQVLDVGNAITNAKGNWLTQVPRTKRQGSV